MGHQGVPALHGGAGHSQPAGGPFPHHPANLQPVGGFSGAAEDYPERHSPEPPPFRWGRCAGDGGCGEQPQGRSAAAGGFAKKPGAALALRCVPGAESLRPGTTAGAAIRRSEYTIRTKISELQKERKALIAKVLAENDDVKYDFQFARIKQELEQLQAQLEGVQTLQKAQAVDAARMAEIAALLEKFKESDLAFDDLLVRKVVEMVKVESAEKLEIMFKDGNRRAVSLHST